MLHLSSEKYSMLCVTHELFPVSEVLIISITIMLFGSIFVALGFLLPSITSLFKAAIADVC